MQRNFELRRKDSDEEFFQMEGQNILKKEQEIPQNSDQLSAQGEAL